MIHVSDISAEKRINHPQDVLKVGQVVKAQVLAIDTGKAPPQARHEAAGADQHSTSTSPNAKKGTRSLAA